MIYDRRWLVMGVVLFGTALNLGSGCLFLPPNTDGGSDGDTTLPPRTTISVSANGPSEAVSAGDTVSLTALFSEPQAGLIFNWLQTAGQGVVISGANTAVASFTAPSLQSQGSLSFVVTVSDGQDAVGRATVNVTVAADPDFGIDPNDPTRPMADAGDDVTQSERVDFSLSGSDSSGLSLEYRWAQTAGSAVTIADPNQEEISFELPAFVDDGENTLTFALTVRDERGRTNTDDVQVTVTEATLPRVSMTTTLGEIVIELEEVLAPLHTANFLQYVDSEFYVGTIFHRVVNGPDIFVVQGGGFNADLELQDPNDPVQLEADNGLLNVAGTLGAARTSDPNSATSQFFFNPQDNSGFDPANNPPGFTVFGRVIRGFEVVLDIQVVPTNSQGGFDDVPITPVIVTAVSRVEN